MRRRTRLSNRGNTRLRKALHLPKQTAVRFNPAQALLQSPGGCRQDQGAGGGGVPAQAGDELLRVAQEPRAHRSRVELKKGPLTTRYLVRRRPELASLPFPLDMLAGWRAGVKEKGHGSSVKSGSARYSVTRPSPASSGASSPTATSTASTTRPSPSTPKRSCSFS